jgi:hypothetical protein
VVKAISDFADSAKDDDWHRYSAEAAARFAIAVLGSAPAAGRRRQAVPSAVPVTYPGRVKVLVCRRLHADWEDVADILGVPVHDKARFRPGHQPGDLWVWLEVREKLSALPAALDKIGRSDLGDLMRSER